MTKNKCLCKTPSNSGIHSAIYCGPRFRWQNETHTDFRITDMLTDSRVATCYVKENADLICHALNLLHSKPNFVTNTRYMNPPQNGES